MTTEAMEELHSDAEDSGFGALEMFDSNAMAAHPSSQAPAAPLASGGLVADEAVAWQDSTPAPSSKKHKRGKKSGLEHAVDPSLSLVGGRSKKKHKSKDKKAPRLSDSQVPADQAVSAEGQAVLETAAAADGSIPSTAPTLGASGVGDDTAPPSSMSKTKRKLSDSADRKQRKKHRSHGHALMDQEAADAKGAESLASAAAFLHISHDQNAPLTSAVDDGAVEATDPQNSPTVAYLRRRSQSHEVRSRGNSIPRDGAQSMDVDPPVDQAVVATATANDGVPAQDDVEALAREAWNEHRQRQNPVPSHQGEANDTPPAPAPEPSDPSSKQTRQSSRKRAKPTFEQPPAEVARYEAHAARNALAELPSPTAMTPKPRARDKAAAKKSTKGKRPKKEKRAKQAPENGGLDAFGAQENGEGGESRRARRDRLAGFTKGRFTDEELARIARVVEAFRGENDLSQQQVNEVKTHRAPPMVKQALTRTQMIHMPGGTTAGNSHAELWERIFEECPGRHRQKVINITRKKFHNFVARGTWTAEQDAELTGLIRVHGLKWSKIGAIINRHPEDLRDRYRNYLICGLNQRKDAWDEVEEARLTQFVIHAMDTIDELRLSTPNLALLNMSYEELIDWQNISEQMGRTRSRLQCITKWKALNIQTHGKDKLVSGEPDAQISFRLEKARRQIAAMPDDEKFRLVLAIGATDVDKDVKIPWSRLVDKKFRHQWHRPTQMLLWRRLRQSLPGWDTKKTTACALELAELYTRTGELPDVGGGGFDDVEEMNFVQAIPSASLGAGAGADTRELGNKSTQLVADSDVEDGKRVNGDVLEAAENDDDLQIDPALVQTPVPAKKATTAKRTGTGKPPARKTSKKAPTANMDPIEDDDGNDDEAGEEDGGSEVEAPPTRQRKTPRRFRSPRDGRTAQGATRRSTGSESNMDDMEDLPARASA